VIGAIVWRTLLLAIAIVAAGVQLDRQTEKTPDLAEMVPEPFRSSAQHHIAVEAVSDGEPARALDEVRTLVARRPLPAEHLRLLSQAQFGAGDPATGVMTIQYAAQRGWRDAFAQDAMLRLALEAGDESEAARRLVALMLSRQASEEGLRAVANELLREPRGEARQVVSNIMTGAQRRRGQFVARGARILPPAAYVEIVETMSDRGVVFDCNALRGAGRTLERRTPDERSPLAGFMQTECP